MTQIMWIYDSQYGPHESNYGDLWFETVRLWLKRPGHCSETPDLLIERPGHCSEIPDLWFEIRDAWLEIYGFVIRSTGRMNRNTVGLGLDRPGHCSEIPDLWIERPGHCSSMNRNTRFMIRHTRSITSSETVYLTTRRPGMTPHPPPPPRPFVESYFYLFAPGSL